MIEVNAFNSAVIPNLIRATVQECLRESLTADTVACHPVQQTMILNMFTDVVIMNPKEITRILAPNEEILRPEMKIADCELRLDAAIPINQIWFESKGKTIAKLVSLAVPIGFQETNDD